MKCGGEEGELASGPQTFLKGSNLSQSPTNDIYNHTNHSRCRHQNTPIAQHESYLKSYRWDEIQWVYITIIWWKGKGEKLEKKKKKKKQNKIASINCPPVLPSNAECRLFSYARGSETSRATLRPSSPGDFLWPACFNASWIRIL